MQQRPRARRASRCRRRACCAKPVRIRADEHVARSPALNGCASHTRPLAVPFSTSLDERDVAARARTGRGCRGSRPVRRPASRRAGPTPRRSRSRRRRRTRRTYSTLASAVRHERARRVTGSDCGCVPSAGGDASRRRARRWSSRAVEVVEDDLAVRDEAEASSDLDSAVHARERDGARRRSTVTPRCRA